VRALDRVSGAERFRFTAFPGFTGGAQVAVGDVNADGVLDIIVAAGPGGGPHVRVFDGTTGNQVSGAIGSFFAYSANFSGGVMVAAADITGDGRAEVITAPAGNGGPHVRIFNGANGSILGEYFAYAGGFSGGVRVAAGDIDGNGTPDVITAAGPGGGPHVKVYSGASATLISNPLASFFAYGGTFTGGVYVASGDVNGDGRADIITGPGAGGGPHVRVFSGVNGAEIHSFFAYGATFTGGVRVAAARVNGDNRADIVTSAGTGGGPHVRVFDGATRAELLGFFAYEGSFTGGVYVAGSLTAASGGSPILSSLLAAEPHTSTLIQGLAFDQPAPRSKPRTGSAGASQFGDLHDRVFSDLDAIFDGI
jgi:hypothetical protein